MNDEDPHLEGLRLGTDEDLGGTHSDKPVIVFLVNEQKLAVDEQRLIDLAKKTVVSEGASGEMSLFLVGEEEIAEINERYLGEEGPTDVISFPIEGLSRQADPEGPPVLIGEVVLCPSVAIANAPSRDTFAEQELDLLVVHGVLHLFGYDHETKEQAEIMRAREFALIGHAGAEAP